MCLSCVDCVCVCVCGAQCFFERSSAELIKPSRVYAAEKGKKRDEARWLWAMAIDSSVGNAIQGRRPPLAPAAFRELLKATRFTNNADADGVAGLFEKTATNVLAATPTLYLAPPRELLEVAVAIAGQTRPLYRTLAGLTHFCQLQQSAPVQSYSR